MRCWRCWQCHGGWSSPRCGKIHAKIMGRFNGTWWKMPWGHDSNPGTGSEEHLKETPHDGSRKDLLFSWRYSKSTQWQAKMHDGPFKKTIPQSGWVSTKVTKDYNFCGSNGIPIFELYKVLFPQSCLLVANQFTIVILLMISTINQHTHNQFLRHLTYLSAINQHVFSVIPSHFHQWVAPIQKYTYSCGPKY